MIPVLDTSILIELRRGKQETRKKINEIIRMYDDIPQVTFPSIVEFLEGILRKNEENQFKNRAFLSKFPEIHTDRNSAETMATLRYKYNKTGTKIKMMDLLIASLFFDNNMMLITRDKDFEKIDELKKIILD